MYIGEDRQPRFGTNFFENTKPLVQARPAKRVARRTVGLVEGTFINHLHIKAPGNGGQGIRDMKRMLFAFDHARPGNHE